MSSELLSSHRLKPSKSPRLLPPDVLIEEELVPRYQPDHFLQVAPGDVLGSRFELQAKLGFGTSSTVWMTKDMRRRQDANPYAAVKICTSNIDDQAATQHELEISKHIIDCARGDETKYEQLLVAHDSFEVMGVSGSHLCLVMEAMREPLWLMRRRLCDADWVTAKTLVVFKLYMLHVLGALQYLHNDCHIIHTDLKLDNIMLGLESESVLNDFLAAQADNPMPRKISSSGHTIYLSHNNFGDLQRVGDEHAIFTMLVKLADFGLAQRGDTSQTPLVFPIQGDQFHAPEVILGTGWSYSADIWNFGVMVWNLLAGKDIFQRVNDEAGAYSAKHHLADMVSLMGPMPKQLIEREKDGRQWRWTPAALNDKGKLCTNVADFYGGPFIDDDGRFVGLDHVTSDQSLADIVPECITAGQEKDDFLDFMSHILCWLPEERKSAAELQKHPWLTRWLTRPTPPSR